MGEFAVVNYDRVNTNVTVLENNKNVEEMQGVYYYWLDDEIINQTINNNAETKGINTEILGLSNAIQSVVYVPYMNRNEVTGIRMNFDVERYGWTNNNSIGAVPLCYRITRYPTNKTIDVNNFFCYKSTHMGGARNWRNESRLFNYPYSFGILTDFIGDPLEFKYHLCPSDQVKPFVRTTLSNFGTYNFGILGYKGDTTGQLEGIVNSKSLDIPNSSSAYSNWASTSRAQTNVNLATGFFNGVNNVVGSAFHGNAQGLINGGISIAHNIGSNLAMKTDLQTTPKTMLSMGADVNFAKALSGALSLQEEGGLYHLRYQMEETYLQKLGDYFAMYGYKVNAMLRPNLFSRSRYNYIKTVGVNIKTNSVPKQHLNKLKEIYDAGITFWHTENCNMLDYSMDNTEV